MPRPTGRKPPTGTGSRSRSRSGTEPGRSPAKAAGRAGSDGKTPPKPRGKAPPKRKAPPSLAKTTDEARAKPASRGGTTNRTAKSKSHRDGEPAPAKRQRSHAPGKPRPAPLRGAKPHRGAPPEADPNAVSAPMRIAKAMAKAGLCSRRDAEAWIAEGRVTLNGKRLDTPAVVVSPGDRVLVDGEPLPAHEPPQLWRYHKPRGRVTTHRDPEGRPTVFEAMPEEMPRVISIGRLDFNTEGLLLLTTDGDLARHLELPSTGWLRRYRVRAHGDVTPEALAKLSGGITIDGISYGPVEASIDSKQGGNVWLSVALREGKNREVRNIMANLGLTVNRLIRISYGPFQLQDLAIGQVELVKRKVLVDQLGPNLSQQLGLRTADDLRSRGGTRRRPNANTKKTD
jgi:23S rRNA pseudouridine2605 synthase